MNVRQKKTCLFANLSQHTFTRRFTFLQPAANAVPQTLVGRIAPIKHQNLVIPCDETKGITKVHSAASLVVFRFWVVFGEMGLPISPNTTQNLKRPKKITIYRVSPAHQLRKSR